jgi:hypothetical protein
MDWEAEQKRLEAARQDAFDTMMLRRPGSSSTTNALSVRVFPPSSASQAAGDVAIEHDRDRPRGNPSAGGLIAVERIRRPLPARPHTADVLNVGDGQLRMRSI